MSVCVGVSSGDLHRSRSRVSFFFVFSAVGLDICVIVFSCCHFHFIAADLMCVRKLISVVLVMMA